MTQKRGRPSAASLEIATRPLETVPRLTAPHELNDEETEVWFAVVNSQAADWFDAATAPMLTQYCRHVVQARRVAELIEKATSDIDPETKKPTLSVVDYDRLLKMQQRESAIIKTLATSMRISQQATTNHRGNRKPKPSRKPWES